MELVCTGVYINDFKAYGCNSGCPEYPASLPSPYFKLGAATGRKLQLYRHFGKLIMNDARTTWIIYESATRTEVSYWYS